MNTLIIGNKYKQEQNNVYSKLNYYLTMAKAAEKSLLMISLRAKIIKKETVFENTEKKCHSLML